jgi:HEAT repeat protein
MRARTERRIRKRLRSFDRGKPAHEPLLERLGSLPGSLEKALEQVMLDASAGYWVRGDAARMLALFNAKRVRRKLLQLFLSQAEDPDVLETALTIERLNDPGLVPALVQALHDNNPHRRRGAARALGWIQGAGPRAAGALVRVVLDATQPAFVREEAAESLASYEYRWVVTRLAEALQSADPGLQFWIAFALGSRRGSGPHWILTRGVARTALESLLSVEAEPEGWWPVRLEALAMLDGLSPEYSERMEAELQRIEREPISTEGERRWVETYGPSSAHRDPQERD